MYLLLISLGIELIKAERKPLNGLFQVLHGKFTPLDGIVAEVLSVVQNTELLRQLSV